MPSTERSGQRNGILYRLARPLLFSLDAETVHHLTLSGLQLAYRLGLHGNPPSQNQAVEVMGLRFPNAVGLAAGLDKNGAYIDALAALGFGFIEIGTVTPRPQPGNPQPRLFRLPKAQAIINRMGFNNLGVAALLKNVQAARYRGILGINIGKNADTPIERAADDYLSGLEAVYPYASYVAINISSPNTRNLRALQSADALDHLLQQLKTAQIRLADQHGRYVPIAIKIAPDLSAEELQSIATLLKQHHIDAVIATNTTLRREAVTGLPHADEVGGLSGAPLTAASTAVIHQLSTALAGELPIIGAGGIMSGKDALDKRAAGASLVQLYTGLIYRGPALIGECIRTLDRPLH
ncbi:MAG: quinone-dependent dihydroorotate dehydrogenase [Betaproteobacteria bacterium]|nr:quinone-dependent dihydroorotate dehydrogenase [Betaproteobacteria bacterium]